MAAGGTSRALRSRTINVEGMAGEGVAANSTQGAPGTSTTRNAAQLSAPGPSLAPAAAPSSAAGPSNPAAAPSSVVGPSNPAFAAPTNPVFLERVRLRDQARKGKLSARKSAAELVGDLQSATIGASQAVNDLWPNLLRDSDVFAFDIVPDTEDPYDSQLPSPREEDFDRLAEDVKHLGEHMKHVQSCLEEVVERGWVGQAGKDQLDLDSDETEEIPNNNEGSQPAQPGPNETQPPPQELSEDNEDSMDGEAPYHVAAAVAAEGGGPAVGRQLVHKDHVAKLVTVYQKAMQTFTRSKKGVAPAQLIPNKVWQQIYREYKLEFPASSFKEDSLKDHLRASLKDLTKQKESPADCEEVNDPSADEELLTRLMATDSWKARNVLQSRMDAMESLSAPKSAQRTPSATPAGSSTSGQTSSVAPPKTTSGTPAAAHIPFKPPTKSQNLKDARQDMAAMLVEFKSMSEGRHEDSSRKQKLADEDSSRKRKLADGKSALHEAKRQESEERRKALEEQGKMSRINLIKEQKSLGLISEDEFLEKCRIVFQL